MCIIDVDENEEQCPSIIYLYPGQLFYLAYNSSLLHGGGLSLNLLSFHFKLSKDCTLWPKASLKRWLGPQVAWLILQVIQRRYLVLQGTATATALLQLLRYFLDLSKHSNLQLGSNPKA
jgi:hypothetical protein